MQHRIITSVAVLMGALILAIIAGVVPVFPFSTEETAYAQTSERPDDATLAAATTDPETTGLSLGAGVTLTPEYAPGTTEYTARVVNPVNVVTVTARTNNSEASRTISPRDADTPDEGHQVALRAGQKTRLTVTVRAEDRRTTKTYTVTIYRERSTPSADATLSAVGLAGVSLSPRFSSDKIAYDARVRYDVDEVTVAATAKDIGAMAPVVGINADLTGDDDASVDTDTNVVTLGGVGTDTAITVTVTAEGDGPGDDDSDPDTKVYTITVYRESGPVLSGDATLGGTDALSLGTEAELEPTFNSDITEYTVRAANTVELVTVVATPNGDPGATFKVMPADQNTSDTGPGHEVYLTPGRNTAITVTVTAEDGSTNTYTVMVYRVNAPASTDATLSALSLAGLSLSPAFDPAKTAYDARVRYDVEEVTVEAATAAHIGAMTPVVGINDTIETDDDTATIDTATNVVTLGGVGTDTAITVTVTPEAGATGGAGGGSITKTYTITVYRESGPVLSDDATLGGTDALSLKVGTAATGTDVMTLSPASVRI